MDQSNAALRLVDADSEAAVRSTALVLRVLGRRCWAQGRV